MSVRAKWQKQEGARNRTGGGGWQVPGEERYGGRRSKMAFCGWEVLGFVEGCFVGDSKLYYAQVKRKYVYT